MSHSLNKITVERNQRALLELVAQPGNDVCADCKARNPRWASYNLGIFICVNCASIHRKIGTHVTKVKSLNLDSWTKEQVETMRQNGNLKSNNLYNPDEVRHPPPTNMLDLERDSELERYIRAKYEHKRYLNRPALVASFLGPPSRKSPSRPRSIAIASPKPPPSPSPSRTRDKQAPLNTEPAKVQSQPVQETRSAPQPVSTQPSPPQQPQQTKNGNVWDDLISLQTSGSQNASLPLQYQTMSPPMISVTATGQAFVEPGIAINPGYSPMLTTQPLQGVTADPTGLPVHRQGQFPAVQMQLPPQQQMGMQPVFMQATADHGTLGPAYPAATHSMGTMGAMATGIPLLQFAPRQTQPSPSLPTQFPAYLQQHQYTHQLTPFPTQAVGQLNPQAFQPQTSTVIQAQPFQAQSFMQPTMLFGQPQQMQMFTPTGQFGGWQQQTAYQSQQWGNM